MYSWKIIYAGFESLRELTFSTLPVLGMGVVTVSSSASRTPVGLGSRFSAHISPLRRPSFLAFKTDKSKDSTLVSPHESIPLPIDAPKDKKKSLRRPKTKSTERLKAVSTNGTSPCTADLDYNEAAAKLENIYKRSPTNVSVAEDSNHLVQKRRRMCKRIVEGDEKKEKEMVNVVRNHRRKTKRLTLEKRIALRKKNVDKEEPMGSLSRRKDGEASYNIDRLVNGYSIATDLVSLDWKKMKIPPVLSSSEHSLLFKLMQPMKVSCYFMSFPQLLSICFK